MERLLRGFCFLGIILVMSSSLQASRAHEREGGNAQRSALSTCGRFVLQCILICLTSQDDEPQQAQRRAPVRNELQPPVAAKGPHPRAVKYIQETDEWVIKIKKLPARYSPQPAGPETSQKYDQLLEEAEAIKAGFIALTEDNIDVHIRPLYHRLGRLNSRYLTVRQSWDKDVRNAASIPAAKNKKQDNSWQAPQRTIALVDVPADIMIPEQPAYHPEQIVQLLEDERKQTEGAQAQIPAVQKEPHPRVVGNVREVDEWLEKIKKLPAIFSPQPAGPTTVQKYNQLRQEANAIKAALVALTGDNLGFHVGPLNNRIAKLSFLYRSVEQSWGQDIKDAQSKKGELRDKVGRFNRELEWLRDFQAKNKFDAPTLSAAQRFNAFVREVGAVKVSIEGFLANPEQRSVEIWKSAEDIRVKRREMYKFWHKEKGIDLAM